MVSVVNLRDLPITITYSKPIGLLLEADDATSNYLNKVEFVKTIIKLKKSKNSPDTRANGKKPEDGKNSNMLNNLSNITKQPFFKICER